MGIYINGDAFPGTSRLYYIPSVGIERSSITCARSLTFLTNWPLPFQNTLIKGSLIPPARASQLSRAQEKCFIDTFNSHSLHYTQSWPSEYYLYTEWVKAHPGQVDWALFAG